MTETKQALLPCPFCGHVGVGTYEGSTFRWRYASCDECDARAGEVRHDTMADDQDAAEVDTRNRAIAAWNTRALPTDWQPTPEAINALPEPLRAYIHRIQTSHPSYDNAVRIRQLEEQVEQLQAALGEAERDAGRWRSYVASRTADDSHCCRSCGHPYTPAAGESEDCPRCGHDGSAIDAMAAGEDAK